MHFENDEEIVDLVRRFESCEIHPADFRHYQHLTVALWYVRQFPYATASEKIRTGIQRLAAAYGKTGYHETITRFWLVMVRDFAAAVEQDEAICDLANRMVTSYENKDLIKEYYSEELVDSSEAKAGWVEPDLKSLPIAKGSAPSACGSAQSAGRNRASE
jgi:hypothetical protein